MENLNNALTKANTLHIGVHELEQTKKDVFNILECEVCYHITLEEALEISKWIIEENKIKPHMCVKSENQIMNEINNWLWIILKFNWKVVWCISMIKINIWEGIDIYEAWSLICDNTKRNLWIAKKLTTELFSVHKNKAIYSITEVSSVKHIYEKINLFLVQKNNLNLLILNEIEKIAPLLETDVIYWNEAFLSFNKKIW